MEWITTENVYDESWRRLLEYANVELAIDAISSIHGTPSSKELPNYKKQAEQVRAALLQAKEYFEAAKSSSLYTKPNHLYYGSVALSTACMLIRGNGAKSLDYLRKDPKNANHGLDFSFSSDIKQSKLGIKLLENSYVKICPNGHFSNWYNTLLNEQKVEALVVRSQGGMSSHNMEDIGSLYKIPDFEEIKNFKNNLLFAIKRLPDLCPVLGRYGIDVDFARGEQTAYIGNDSTKSYHKFTFHSAPSNAALMKVVEMFTCEETVNFTFDIPYNATAGIITTRTDKFFPFGFPDSRTTLDNKTIYYADATTTPEVVDLFLVSYALSMLSRYFPDIWISFLDSHCKGAKLVERIVHILMLKMPNLMLNQMTGNNFVISNHRPPWH